MANIKVVIEEVIKGKGNVKQVTGDLSTLETTSRRVTASAKASSFSMTDFASALSLVRQGLQAAEQLYDATAGATINYANEVRTLSQVSGASAEDSSRLIQVLDDYKISAGEATIAAKALKEKGLVPTIDTLAKLSDGYLAIQDPAKKLEYVQDNLGKGGMKWIEVLEKGSKAIREQGDAVSDSLIFDQKKLDAARENEIAMDRLSESWEAMAFTIGNKAIPAVTGVVDEFNRTTRAIEIMKEKGLNPFGEMLISSDNYVAALKQAQDEQEASTKAMLEGKDAAGEFGEGIEGTVDPLKEAEEVAKLLTHAYQGLLSSMFSIQSENEGYEDTVKSLTEKTADLAAEKDQLTLKMWEEQRAGKLTADQQLEYIKQFDELNKKMQENQTAITDAAEEHKQAATQRVYDLVQERLAADGVVSSGEFEYLQDLAVQKGLVSRAAADQAIAESQAADELIGNFAKTQPVMNDALTTMMQIASMDGRIVQFGLNFTQTGVPTSTAFSPANYYGANQNNPTRPSAPSRPRVSMPVMHSHDSGGWGEAGEIALIGRGAQPEAFIPSTNGTFVPNADKLGATYNIVVNNPVRETAENSIRQQLKKLSYAGVIS